MEFIHDHGLGRVDGTLGAKLIPDTGYPAVGGVPESFRVAGAIDLDDEHITGLIGVQNCYVDQHGNNNQSYFCHDCFSMNFVHIRDSQVTVQVALLNAPERENFLGAALKAGGLLIRIMVNSRLYPPPRFCRLSAPP